MDVMGWWASTGMAPRYQHVTEPVRADTGQHRRWLRIPARWPWADDRRTRLTNSAVTPRPEKKPQEHTYRRDRRLTTMPDPPITSARPRSEWPEQHGGSEAQNIKAGLRMFLRLAHGLRFTCG